MSVKQDRINTANIVRNAARVYKSNLIGREFLYVFDRRYIKVLFLRDNFKHLTGVDSNLSATQFYRNAIKGILTWRQLYFSSNHPYDLCQKKLKHLNDISNLAFSDTVMLEEITTNTQTYKFGATNLDFTLLFNQANNAAPSLDTPYHTISLRDEDCFDKSKNTFVVTHIFSKANNEKVYSSLLFTDSKAQNSDIPDNIISQLSEELRSSMGL